MSENNYIDINNPAVQRSVQIIGKALGETDPRVAFQLSVMRALTDDKFMAKILHKTGELRQAKNLPMTDDGKRERTVGGTFFKLAKNEMDGRTRYRYFMITRGGKGKKK